MPKSVAVAILLGSAIAAAAAVTGFPVDAVASIVINEVELNPAGRDAGGEWIELLNEGDVAVDLAGWTVTFNYRSPGELAISEEPLELAPGEMVVFTYPRLMLRNADNTTIELRDPDGNLVYRTGILNDEKNDGETWQRFDLGADPLFGDLWVLTDGTKGKPNKLEMVVEN
jgi:hypothetical protein